MIFGSQNNANCVYLFTYLFIAFSVKIYQVTWGGTLSWFWSCLGTKQDCDSSALLETRAKFVSKLNAGKGLVQLWAFCPPLIFK